MKGHAKPNLLLGALATLAGAWLGADAFGTEGAVWGAMLAFLAVFYFESAAGHAH